MRSQIQEWDREIIVLGNASVVDIRDENRLYCIGKATYEFVRRAMEDPAIKERVAQKVLQLQAERKAAEAAT